MKIAISIVVILAGIYFFSNIESLKGSDESGKKPSATSGIAGGNEDKSHFKTPNRDKASIVDPPINSILKTRNDKPSKEEKIKFKISDPTLMKKYVPYENIKPKTATPESPKK